MPRDTPRTDGTVMVAPRKTDVCAGARVYIFVRKTRARSYGGDGVIIIIM